MLNVPRASMTMGISTTSIPFHRRFTSLSRSLDILFVDFFRVLLNMHALITIIIFIIVIISIGIIISNITLVLFLLLLFINHVSMVHFNVRSLTNKFDDLINYLNSLSFSFSLTALTETWLNESDISDETQISGYRIIIVNRKHKKGEGVNL